MKIARGTFIIGVGYNSGLVRSGIVLGFAQNKVWIAAEPPDHGVTAWGITPESVTFACESPVPEHLLPKINRYGDLAN